MSLSNYSTFFSCLYDEVSPVGKIGRGTHYSVMRSVEWLNVIREPLPLPEIHDFAVIWDEDHDTRIIPVIERLYMAGLLSPVQFIGERKGGLTVVVAAKFYFSGSDRDTENYRRLVNEVGNGAHGDHWVTQLGSFDRSLGSPHQTFPESIIRDSEQKIETYLRNIDNLWTLGTKPYSLKPVQESMIMPA